VGEFAALFSRDLSQLVYNTHNKNAKFVKAWDREITKFLYIYHVFKLTQNAQTKIIYVVVLSPVLSIEPNTFSKDLSSGYLIGEVLHKYQLQDDFSMFIQSK